jgi:sugar-specific transcriptional regulator TrmB
MARIAAKTQLKRPTVYAVVQILKTKGIVAILKKRGIQYVSALSPRLLIERFAHSTELAVQALPELLEMAYASPLKPRLQFFEGWEGILQVLRQFSYSKIPCMGFTDYEQMPKELFQFIRKTVIPERIKNKNKARLIVPDNPTNWRIQLEDNKYFTEHRIVPFSIPRNPIELLLFGESSVAFLSFIQEEMFGVTIDSPAIYNTLKNIFLYLWNASGQLASQS